MLALPALIAALPSLLLLPAVSNAGGVTNVTCNDTSINWAFNANSLTPCQIAANLSAVCSSDGVFTIGPLEPVFDNGYLPPDSPSKCTCNTVTYSMISACSLCQGGIVTAWPFWYSNCSGIGTNGSFPYTIPPNTDVPKWAYLDVLSKNKFDPVEAQAIGDKPEVKSGSSPFSLPVNASPSSGKKKSNIGAIVGGVVGGIVALIALLGLALFLIRRRKNNAQGTNTEKNYATTSLPQSPIAGQYQYQNPQEPDKNYVTTAYQSPLLSAQGTGHNSSNNRPYDPNDPSTFPVSPMSHHNSMGGNGSYHSSEPTGVPMNVQHAQQGYGQPQHQQRQSYAGGYSGVAEI